MSTIIIIIFIYDDYVVSLLLAMQVGEQGWRSGESIRLPWMWPEFDLFTGRHIWTDIVGSLLCSERFFPEYPKPTLNKKSQSLFDLSWSSLICNLLN